MFRQNLTELQSQVDELWEIYKNGQTERAKSVCLMKELLDEVSKVTNEICGGAQEQ